MLTAGCGGDDEKPAAKAKTTQTEASTGQDLAPPTASREPRAEPPQPPRIVERPIPFGPERKKQMAAYAQRHYGIDSYELDDPHVIVQHITVSDDFESVYNTFAANTPDVELNELPGVCSHYVVDKDGTIYRLVPESIMCRHTVGLNWTAIGIEHVARTDADLLGNRRQLRASRRLTQWIQCRRDIGLRDVIGHNESLSSRYHKENVARLRTQTHGDMTAESMREYESGIGDDTCG